MDDPDQQRTPAPETLRRRAAASLPRGGSLTDAGWATRHRAILVVAWLHVGVLIGAAAARGLPPGTVLPATAVVAALASAAGLARSTRTLGSVLATLSLVTSSAVLVALFGGRTELHFDYFVVVAVVALYQAWWPYLVAVGFVLLEHGVVGSLAPALVFDMHMRSGTVWATSAVHGLFILAESIACVMFWKAGEDAVASERRALADAEAAHRDLEHAQELAEIGSWTFDVATERLTWSRQLFAIYGVDPETFVPTMTDVVGMIHAEDRERVAGDFARAVETAAPVDLEYRVLRPDGQVRTVHALSEQPATPEGASRRRIGTVQDVTERVALQAEIAHLAYHDPLTGLANRRLFLAEVERALTRTRPEGATCAVLYLDLDGFKGVNDSHGHAVGDQLLRATAERLSRAVRSTDVVGRLGGDEFAILLDHVTAASTHRIAEQVSSHLRQPLLVAGIELRVAASVGVALAGDCSTPDDLVGRADAAMYARKVRLGRSAGDRSRGLLARGA